MKRTRNAAHDNDEVACLERLSEELDHPSRSRREGARAALRCLNRLANLRAAAGEVSSSDAWVQVFNTNQELLESAVREPIAPRSVDQIVEDMERDITDRAQARERARYAGIYVLPDLDN